MDILTLAIDPGLTTGFSIGNITDLEFRITSQQAQLSHIDLYDLVRQLKPAFTICESFEYRNRQKANVELFPKELIGVLHLLDQQCFTKLSLQTAAEGKGNFTDEKLKSMGLYNTKRHGRDAVRHQLHWFTFRVGFQFNKDQPIRLVEEII